MRVGRETSNTQMSIKELITELQTSYAHAGLDCGDGLLPPATLESILHIESQLALPVTEELKEVLLVHGGQNYIAAGTTGLFGWHRLHTPQEIIEHHQANSTYCMNEGDPLEEFPPKLGEWGYWVPDLIPFASWDANELCIHSESGSVWEFCASIGLKNFKPNITAVIQELLAALHAGIEPKLRQGRTDLR